MRIGILVLLSAAVGCALGIGATWGRYRAAAPLHATVETADGSAPWWAPPDGPQPKLQIDAVAHDFEVVAAGSVVEHKFSVKNIGGYPLALEPLGTSCASCTIGRIGKSPLAPGESTDIAIEYHAGDRSADFRKTASIRTNDRRHQPLTLTVFGRVVPPLEADPRDVVFSKLDAGKGGKARVLLLAYFSDALQVVAHELLDTTTADKFDVALRTLPADELRRARARSGYVLEISVKPGLPLGRTRQSLRVMTSLADEPLVVPIDVEVVSDVSVVGSAAVGWDSARSVLLLGSVHRSKGARRELAIVVRGPHRRDVKIEVDQTVPDWLKASVAASRPMADGSAVRFPITIEVPPGSPTVNRLGQDSQRWGSILLRTTHPDAKQIRIQVSFAVED